MAEDDSTHRQGDDTIFGKILRKEVPCDFIYQDEQVVAFHDIDPVAPIHFLVIPRKFIDLLCNAQQEDERLLGHLMLVARKVANQLGLQNGYRVVINNHRGRDTVYHLHLHVMGGRPMKWPPG
ncbi:adenosine 5'-monophosphoramidase HINT1-like [Glandiceps talaboti]